MRCEETRYSRNTQQLKRFWMRREETRSLFRRGASGDASDFSHPFFGSSEVRQVHVVAKKLQHHEFATWAAILDNICSPHVIDNHFLPVDGSFEQKVQFWPTKFKSYGKSGSEERRSKFAMEKFFWKRIFGEKNFTDNLKFTMGRNRRVTAKRGSQFLWNRVSKLQSQKWNKNWV